MPSGAPAFNPNQPFQEVADSPPPFDPNQPAEEISNESPVASGVRQEAQAQLEESFPRQFARGAIETLPIVGAIAGGTFGGGLLSPSGYAGAGLGFAVGKQGEQLLKEKFFPEDTPQTTPLEKAIQVPGDVYEGAKGQLFGNVLGAAAGPAIKVATNVFKGTGKFAAKVFGGVRGDVVEEYVKNADRINAAQSMDEVKSALDETIQKLTDDVSNAKISVDKAKEIYKETAANTRFQTGIARTEAREAVSQAQRALDDAFKSHVEKLKGISNPNELADEAVNSVAKLKQNVVEGSQEAYAVLEKHSATGAKMPTRGLADLIDKSKESLKISGVRPIAKTAQSTFKLLDDYAVQLRDLPPDIPLNDAKKLIQQIDGEIAFINDAGGFSDDASRALGEIRRAIDTRLKFIPEYQDIMKRVAEDTRLLQKSNKLFGKKESAVSTLSNIASPNKITQRQALNELGKRVNVDFDTPVASFSKTQRQLKSPTFMDAAKQSLPEAAKLKESQRALARQKRVDIRDILKPAEEEVRASTKLLREKERTAAPFSSLGPKSSEQALKRLGGEGSKLELEKTFNKLKKLTDKDFIQMAKDANTKAAFKKGATQGSRNVNLFTALGTGVAALFTRDPLVLGAVASTSATLGATVDKFGPVMTKKAIDAAIKLGGTLNKAKIDAAPIADNLKKVLLFHLASIESNKNKSEREEALKGE